MKKLIFLAIPLLLVVAVPNVYAASNNDRCEGKNYEDISDLPELEEGKCYSTCEIRSEGLVCDIEEIQK